MHIVLLTGHAREHIISEDSIASMLFDSILEKPMQNARLRALIDQVYFTIHCTTQLMQPRRMRVFTCIHILLRDIRLNLGETDAKRTPQGPHRAGTLYYT